MTHITEAEQRPNAAESEFDRNRDAAQFNLAIVRTRRSRRRERSRSNGCLIVSEHGSGTRRSFQIRHAELFEEEESQHAGARHRFKFIP